MREKKKEKRQEEQAAEETVEKSETAAESETDVKTSGDSGDRNSEKTEATEKEPSETEQLKAELSEMEDKFLRARAEIANMTNRNRNERESLVKYRSQDLGKRVLPSLDNLERALAIEVDDEQGASLKKGIEMVLESLLAALKDEGIEEIKADGEVFDPQLHQAVQTIPATDELKADTIAQVLQKGYKLHDRVLRPAMVIVAQ